MLKRVNYKENSLIMKLSCMCKLLDFKNVALFNYQMYFVTGSYEDLNLIIIVSFKIIIQCFFFF